MSATASTARSASTRTARIRRSAFEKLGQQIISCHAKDLQWIVEMNVHFLEVIPGRGQVDYHAYLQGCRNCRFDAPLMLEHLKTAEEYEEGKQYILRIGRENGIAFA